MRFRSRVALIAGSAVLTLFALTLIGSAAFLGERHRAAELERLRAENRHLVSNLVEMEARTQRLGQAMDQLAARDQRYRVIAGLPLLDREVYAVGVGGPAPADPELGRFYAESPALAGASQAATMDLDQLLRRAELLKTSIGEAMDSVEARQDMLRRRPSIYPVESPDAWISSGFSYSRLHPLLGYRRPHEGLDISASAGSPVVATAAGTVVFAGRESGYGRMVEIDHGYGFRTRYAHLARVLARVGQAVERGDEIGEVGRSGLATGPNLHYEVLADGRHVNPWKYLLERR